MNYLKKICYLFICVGFFSNQQHCSSYQTALWKYDTKVPNNEIRALWLIREQIKSKDSIQRIINVMHKYHLNTAIVQVRGRGDAFYHSSLAPRAEGIEEGLDPLAEFIKVARPKGIEVHAWINLFLAADDKTRKWAPKTHLIHKHPEWFIKDQKGRSLLDYSKAEWKTANVEGAFLDPAIPAVRQHNLAIIQELITSYKIDGLHLDYIRYPWSRSETVYDFGRQMLIDTAIQPISNIKVSISNDSKVNYLRRQVISNVVREIRNTLDKHKPGLILTAAVWPSQPKIQNHVFQDFPLWVRHGLIDYAFLMSYYKSKSLHDSRMEQFYSPALNNRFVIGVGLYANPSAEVTLHQIKSARSIGAAGICYFSAEWFLDDSINTKAPKYSLPEIVSPRAKAMFLRNPRNP